MCDVLVKVETFLANGTFLIAFDEGCIGFVARERVYEIGRGGRRARRRLSLLHELSDKIIHRHALKSTTFFLVDIRMECSPHDWYPGFDLSSPINSAT